jgi:hypothetical protein
MEAHVGKRCTPLFILFIVVMVFLAAPHEDAIPVPFEYQKERKVEEKERQATEEALVSLKPPYEPFNWGGAKDRLSVQNAASAIGRQVGIHYNREKSSENTGLLCKRYITPDFENVPWREAMDGILAAPGLKWTIEDGEIVLLTDEQALEREQIVHSLKRELAGSTSTKSKFNLEIGLTWIGLGLLSIAISIPLLKGKIKMNSWYGFRFMQAFQSPGNWYQINRYGAKRLIFWSIVLMLLGCLLPFLPPFDKNPVSLILVLHVPLVLIIAAIESWLYARKL